MVTEPIRGHSEQHTEPHPPCQLHAALPCQEARGGCVQDDNDPDQRTTGFQHDILLSLALIMLSLSSVVLMHCSAAQSRTGVQVFSYLSMLRCTGTKRGVITVVAHNVDKKNTLEMSWA